MASSPAAIFWWLANRGHNTDDLEDLELFHEDLLDICFRGNLEWLDGVEKKKKSSSSEGEHVEDKIHD